MIEKGVAEWILFFSGALLLSAYSFLSKKVSFSGAISGIIIAAVIFHFIYWEGIFYFIAFFLLGTFASKWKYDKKVSLGLAQENKGKRTHVHAISNTGAGAFYATLLILTHQDLFLTSVVVASVFAAATSDTLSSELGNIIGKRYFNIISLQKDQKGKDGVISPEGTFVGLLGSIIIALMHLYFHNRFDAFVIITICGFIANLVDSLLGATLQKQNMLNNHTVNLCTTFLAGLFAIIFYYTTI